MVIWIILLVVVILIAGMTVFLNRPAFGRLPKGERLERIKNSPNYGDDRFWNQNHTTQLTSGKGYISSMIDFLFQKEERLRPSTCLPTIKTNLRGFERKEEILVWMGHSSYFMQTGGKRILVDPVLDMASPVSFFNKAFQGTDIYQPADLPDIDYLVISHDHWDHLDYKTVMEIKDRTGKVICPLGVGEHFEYWGFDLGRIIELDWNEEAKLDEGFTVYCLPARHFSGRGLKPNQSLWASFLFKTPSENIFIGGDGGYDTHFVEIASRFGKIDLAILENGQYDSGWKYIHLLPDDLVKVIKDLNPENVLTVHNSKYALGKHHWDEPMKKISEAAVKNSFRLLTPAIGEVVRLKDSTQVFTRWWEDVK